MILKADPIASVSASQIVVRIQFGNAAIVQTCMELEQTIDVTVHVLTSDIIYLSVGHVQDSLVITIVFAEAHN